MAIAYKIVHNVFPPRIMPQQKDILHLSKDTRVGDWYFFEEYTEIRGYGCELPPYHLPMFVPMRIFALKFIRQSLHRDQIHFVPAKKGYMF